MKYFRCGTITKPKKSTRIREHKGEINDLQNLLEIACQERDEAKYQLRKLIKNLKISYSRVTESNSFSQSLGSSPVNSVFDSVSSPEFANLHNVTDSGTKIGFGNRSLFQAQIDPNCHARKVQIDRSASMINGLVKSPVQTGLSRETGFEKQRFVQNCKEWTAKIDPVDAVIDDLVEGKILPRKGKLLQTVMKSGPLLQNLLLAGPLPQWRNPPPFNVPPVPLNGYDSIQNPAVDLAPISIKGCDPISQMLNFTTCSVPCLNNHFQVAKRHRIQ